MTTREAVARRGIVPLCSANHLVLYLLRQGREEPLCFSIVRLAEGSDVVDLASRVGEIDQTMNLARRVLQRSNPAAMPTTSLYLGLIDELVRGEATHCCDLLCMV